MKRTSYSANLDNGMKPILITFKVRLTFIDVTFQYCIYYLWNMDKNLLLFSFLSFKLFANNIKLLVFISSCITKIIFMEVTLKILTINVLNE